MFGWHSKSDMLAVFNEIANVIEDGPRAVYNSRSAGVLLDDNMRSAEPLVTSLSSWLGASPTAQQVATAGLFLSRHGTGCDAEWWRTTPVDSDARVVWNNTLRILMLRRWNAEIHV